MVHEARTDTDATEPFINVHSVDDAHFARFENGWRGFPFVDPPDQKTNKFAVLFRNEANGSGFPQPGMQPLTQHAQAIRLQAHIRTGGATTEFKPGNQDFFGVAGSPDSYVYFHCDSAGNLR